MLCRNSYMKFCMCMKDIVSISIALLNVVIPLQIGDSPFPLQNASVFKDGNITLMTSVFILATVLRDRKDNYHLHFSKRESKVLVLSGSVSGSGGSKMFCHRARPILCLERHWLSTARSQDAAASQLHSLPQAHAPVSAVVAIPG